ncbi:MAG: ribbon-helix-helix domain-containing protein [Bifidobacteriaceae bacterium]|nr:ribbon-helix-helix domain-containing protein [Bifidobacteriaceae bacterium]
MRATVDLDDPLLRRAEGLARERGIALGTLLDDALRNYFAAVGPGTSPPPAWHTVDGPWVPIPGVDYTSAAAMLDYLDGIDQETESGAYARSGTGRPAGESA